MEHIKVLKVGNYEHVVKEVERPEGMDGNYRGSKMVLCGVLKKGESLKKFLKRRKLF